MKTKLLLQKTASRTPKAIERPRMMPMEMTGLPKTYGKIFKDSLDRAGRVLDERAVA